ncbi:hypothetical protein HWI79_1611 [Cryptosporidium felis]|nr:hypothetical protein HWI79_1611 [Cryptosporidium felis]
MADLSGKSIKELLSELTRSIVRKELGEDADETQYLGLQKGIEDKIWKIILSKNKKLADPSGADPVGFVDKRLSDLVLKSLERAESEDNMKVIRDKRSKVVEAQMICLVPLFLMINKVISHSGNNPQDCALQLLCVFLGSIDVWRLDFWRESYLGETFNSDLTWRLNSLIQKEIRRPDETERDRLKFDFRKDLSTFSSLFFKSRVHHLEWSQLWSEILSDFALGISTFSDLARERRIENWNIFSNRTNKLQGQEESEISKKAGEIADLVFGDLVRTEKNGPKHLEKSANYSSRTSSGLERENSLLASFMGNSEDELEELEATESLRIDSPDPKGELFLAQAEQNFAINIRNSLIEDLDKDQEEGTESKQVSRSFSSYYFFTGLGELKEGNRGYSNTGGRSVTHLSRIRLPALLERVSRRSIVEYDNRYLGSTWDQQYLSQNHSNKAFNESILSVITTERIKNCSGILPNQFLNGGAENNEGSNMGNSNTGYVWMKTGSVLRLFQGFGSSEFSLHPKNFRDERKDFSSIYTLFADRYKIVVRQEGSWGKLTPWMNGFGQGERFVYHGTKKSRGENRDGSLYLSLDLISKMCAFGTKVHYLRSLVELLDFLLDRVRKGGRFVVSEDDWLGSFRNICFSISTSRRVIFEFLQMYLDDLGRCFGRFGELKGTDTSLNIDVILKVFSPAFDMLATVFRLRPSHDQPGIWGIFHGYFLLSEIYAHMWQFQMSSSHILRSASKSELGLEMESRVVLSSGSSSRSIDLEIYGFGHILSTIYETLQKGLLKHQLELVCGLETGEQEYFTLNESMRESVLKSLVPILERVMTIKRALLGDSNSTEGSESLISKGFNSEKRLSSFFSQGNGFVGSRFFGCSSAEDDEEMEEGLGEMNSQTRFFFSRKDTLVEYLRRNRMELEQIYRLYLDRLNEAFNVVCNQTLRVKDHVNMAFAISEALGNVLWEDEEEEKQVGEVEGYGREERAIFLRILGYLRSVLAERGQGKGEGMKTIVGHAESLSWELERSGTDERQLENYMMVNGRIKCRQLFRFVFGLDMGLGKPKRAQKRNSTIQKVEVLGTIPPDFGPEKLFQMIILLDLISKRLLELKCFVGRLSLYIWCRKNTTDFNLYLGFSQGYLYDSFSEELLKLVWGIERKVSSSHYTLERLLEYVISLLERFNLKPSFESKGFAKKLGHLCEPSNGQKWKVVEDFCCKDGLKAKMSPTHIDFLIRLTSLIRQICFILSDLVSRLEPFKDPPKRPSSFSLKKFGAGDESNDHARDSNFISGHHVIQYSSGQAKFWALDLCNLVCSWITVFQTKAGERRGWCLRLSEWLGGVLLEASPSMDTSFILNEEFTGIPEEDYLHQLNLYREFRDLLPGGFGRSKIKSGNSACEQTSTENIENPEFRSLTSRIFSKYFGKRNQLDPEKVSLERQKSEGNEDKNMNYCEIGAVGNFALEKILKKKLLFWIVNNFENQRVPNLIATSQESI